MELGNVIFGNSRGRHEVDRAMQDEWFSYMEEMGFDGYGNHEKSDERRVFENDTFWMMPYYWGDCVCGFEKRDYDWSKANRHSEDCYQEVLKRAKVEAGAELDLEWGHAHSPRNVEYGEWQKIESAIYDRMCAEFGLSREYGCAVHCTCTHDADYADWRSCNDHLADCPIVLPNFWHKPSGFKLEWYKYPLRDSYSNQPLTRKLMRSMFADCIASLE